MEKHYKGLDRSLKLLCDCPHGNQKYSCEYYGNPHVLGKAYVKKAPKFYVGVATFVSSKFSKLSSFSMTSLLKLLAIQLYM